MGGKIGVDQETSGQMLNALCNARLIDSSRHLSADPRRSNWRDALRPFADKLGDSLVADRSPISEVLNVAFAQHEVTSEGIEKQLDFCVQALQSAGKVFSEQDLQRKQQPT